MIDRIPIDPEEPILIGMVRVRDKTISPPRLVK